MNMLSSNDSLGRNKKFHMTIYGLIHMTPPVKNVILESKTNKIPKSSFFLIVTPVNPCYSKSAPETLVSSECLLEMYSEALFWCY